MGVQAPSKPLVIVAEDVEGEALATLVVNNMRGIVKVAAVKAPGFGDRRKAMLQDIAILTGGQVISEEVGLSLEKATLDDLGEAKKIQVTKENTTIIDGAGKHDDAEVGVVPAIDQHGLEGRVLLALGRWQALDDRGEDGVDVEAGLGGDLDGVGGIERAVAVRIGGQPARSAAHRPVPALAHHRDGQGGVGQQAGQLVLWLGQPHLQGTRVEHGQAGRVVEHRRERGTGLGELDDHRLTGLAVVEGMEQRSALYGLLSWKDKVGWEAAGGPFRFEGRQATRRIAGPAGAKGSFLLSTCQMASASRRASSTRATFAPRWRPSRRFVRS